MADGVRHGRLGRLGLSVPEFLVQLRAGALLEGPRAELLGGRVSVPPVLGPAEAAALIGLEDRLRSAGLREEGVLVERAAPLRLGPMDLLRPDLCLLADLGFGAGGEVAGPDGRVRAGRRGPQVQPTIGGSYDPSSVLLVVEVARGRLSLEQRLPLLASAGVRELWLLDLQRGWTEALRAPWQGLYRSRTLWYPGERVPIVSLSGVMIEPLLPP